MNGRRLKWGGQEVVFRHSPIKRLPGEICFARLSELWELYLSSNYMRDTKYHAIIISITDPEVRMRGPWRESEQAALDDLYYFCTEVPLHISAGREIACRFGPYDIVLEPVMGSAPLEYQAKLTEPPVSSITVTSHDGGYLASATIDNGRVYTLSTQTVSSTIEVAVGDLWALTQVGDRLGKEAYS